jgi:hypothetical protein
MLKLDKIKDVQKIEGLIANYMATLITHTQKETTISKYKQKIQELKQEVACLKS